MGWLSSEEAVELAYEDLHRRRTQIALLTDACRARAAVRLAAASARQFTHAGRLVAVDAQFIYLEIVRQRRALDPRARRIRVGFQHRGGWFGFVCDLLDSHGPPAAAQRVCVARLPLTLQRRAGRRFGRLTLPDSPQVRVQFSSMLDESRGFRAVLNDVNSGGLGVTCRDRAEAHPPVGEPFRGLLRLGADGEECEFEFALRLAHLRHKPPDFLRQGWTLLAGDDAARFGLLLERVARLAPQRPQTLRIVKGAPC